MRSTLYFLAFALSGLGLSPGPAMSAETVYIQAGDEVHVIDGQSFQPIGKIDIGDETDDVIGAPDGKMVFVNAMIPNGNPFRVSESGRIFGIDTRTNKIVWRTFVDGMPNHMTVSKDGKRLFVPLIFSNYIIVLDTANGRILDRWYSLIGNHGTELSADGKRLYVGNVIMDGIYIYDADSGKLIKRMETSEAVRPFKFDRGEKRIYYQLSKFHGFEVRDIASGALLRRVDLPKLKNAPKEGTYPQTYNHGMAITPDEKMLLLAGTLDNYIAVYSLPDLKLKTTIAVGPDANWIRVRPDGAVAFVGVRGANHLSVIDLKTFKEIAQVPAGNHAARLAVVNVPDK